MEGLLTLEELTDCLFNHMKGGSSPGIDGFTVNHLRTFWHELKHITQDALNCSFGGQLTQSLRKAVIKLLRKGTKDPTLSGNYRPISLLSIFYKLASCCITQRIKPAVESIKNNNIGSVILNLINMMTHVKQEKKAALILLIDFRKAFDSLEVVGKRGFWLNSSPSFHEGELKWGRGSKFWATPTANFFKSDFFHTRKGKGEFFEFGPLKI